MSVLDASAMLAWLNDEPGAARVQAVLDSGHARISSVNLTEVLTRFVDGGADPAEVVQELRRARLAVVPYTANAALASSRLRAQTRQHGLSLGDRVCLALAEHLGTDVLTADRVWAELALAITVVLIR